mgnify:CR=1 FL=1|jgi:quercetin dioxygenase-like cupin family protein
MLQIKSYLQESNWLPMFGSQALGLSLVKNDGFAADMLRFNADQKTSLHTHPGNHILFVVEGDGWLVFDDDRHDLTKGTCYFVPGSTPHQVIAGSNGMFLLSIADNHRPVDSPERLEILENV